MGGGNGAGGGTGGNSSNCVTGASNGNSTAAGTSGGAGGASNGKMPAILREFVASLDDREWQQDMYKLLQAQSFNQVEVDLFELLCKVLDHNLFAQVDWARNSYYFKELKVRLHKVYCFEAKLPHSIR